MAWWLAYEELYGDMDKEYPIMSKNENVTIVGGDGDDLITFTGMSTAIGAADTVPVIDFGEGVGSDTLNIGTHLPGGMGEDHISFNIDAGLAHTAFDDPKYYATSAFFGDDPYPTVSAVDDAYQFHFPPTDTKPQPNLKDGSTQKYQEDKGIADLKSYVTSTYKGHYTNENSDVQTLDLIHSVGDAESFCRSNALKYLSRYDKKGSAKNDILKAMHYCLLLYYFSGNTQEPDYTNTRYETF